ncbi:MAG: hypothetical protein AB1776_06315 [Bacillota bacterium]
MLEINAQGMPYRELNRLIREAVAAGEESFRLYNVCGQRYIGAGLRRPVYIEIHGVPGNDLGVFMDGPTILVRDNGQDGVGNTMNDGRIVIHGDAGDVLGYGMRGGSLFIRGDVGYRVGIHMKAYREQVPVIVVGGTAGDFFGEYMAGGIMVLLGLYGGARRPLAGDYLGTGMHGGVIYVRGRPEPYRLGKEVRVFELENGDAAILQPLLDRFAEHFGTEPLDVGREPFTKLLPVSHRPYGRLYAT